MKTTFTSKQATVEQCLNDVWQPLPILVFTLFFSIISTSHGGYLRTGSPDAASADKQEYDHVPPVSFQRIQDVTAAQPTIAWDKTLGGSDDERFSSAIPTPDGGYLLGGSSKSNASGDKSENRKGGCDEDGFCFDYWIVKIDAQGNKVWDKTLGGSGSDELSSAIPTPDGGYLLAGSSESNASGDKSENNKGLRDYWIVKIDAQGNKVWDKTLGGSGSDELSSAIPTPDGGYLLAGSSDSNASGDKSEKRKGDFDYWIVKVDALGNKEWDNTLGGNSRDFLSSAIPIPDGGYLLAGWSSSPASGDKSEDSKGGSDYWVVKTDAQGNKVWDKALGGVDIDLLNSAISTPDGGYLLAGWSSSPASGDKSENSKGDCLGEYCDSDYWVIKIDAQGNKVWDKTLGGRDDEGVSSAILTPDGGYLLAGWSGSSVSGDKSENSKGGVDYWVVKIDALGNKVWDKTLGGSEYDFLYSAIPTPDGGYLLGGSSWSNASGDKSEDSKNSCEGCFDGDYWVIELKDNTAPLGPVVTNLTLIDAKTDQEIRALKDGDVISLAEAGSEGLNIRANISGFVDHADLKLKGPVSYSRTEQVFPYALFGDIEGDYEGKSLLTGKYVLTVTPYSKNEKGTAFTVSFQVIEEAIAIQPTLEWDKTLGGSDDEGISSAIPIPNGGYLLAGSSESDASGDKSENRKGDFWSDYWVIKIDALGNKIWDKTLGGSDSDYLSSAIPTPDGGYLLGGSSRSDASGDKSEDSKGGCDEYGNCDSDYWIIKTDADGNKVWDKTLGGKSSDDLSSAILTPDGGYLLGGSSWSNASGDKSENRKGGCDEYGNCDSDYWIIKTDADGNKVWDKTLGGSGFDYLHSAILTPDGGYLLAGESGSDASEDKSEGSKGGSDYWVVKIDEQGNKVWDKALGGIGEDYLYSAIPTSDGGYLLGGYSDSPASGDKSENRKGGSDYSDYWVIKIDAQGNKIWDKTLGGSDGDELNRVISTPDGGYLLGGSSWSNASGDKSENRKSGCDEYGNCFSDYWIIKTDADGNKIWDKTLGGKSSDDLSSAILTPDGGYLLAGSSDSPASGDKSENRKGGCDEYGNCFSDYWIVKLKDENTPTITSLSLIDAATDQEIKELGDGDVINLAEVGNGPLNIRANTSGPIDHVYLKLQGPVRVNRTEREFPYALFGDVEGDYEGRALLAGKYTLTVTPYGGIAHTISFEVTDAPEATARQAKVYPVPTSDMINILHEGAGEEGHMVLLDSRGKMLFHQPLRQQPVEQVDLSAFKKGIYYLRIVSAEGVQVFRVAKE